jgi:hypothetical protein
MRRVQKHLHYFVLVGDVVLIQQVREVTEGDEIDGQPRYDHGKGNG